MQRRTNAQREQQEQQPWLHLDRPIHGNGPKARDTTRGQKRRTTDEQKRQREERVTEPRTPHLYSLRLGRFSPKQAQGRAQRTTNSNPKKKAPHITCTTAVVAFTRCHHRPRRRARYSLRMPLAHISHLAAYPLLPFQGLKAQTKKKRKTLIRPVVYYKSTCPPPPPSVLLAKQGTSPRRLSQNK